MNKVLLPGLRSRLADVRLSSNALIFIAGNFVHRTWGSLGSTPNGVVLPIPYPSNGCWTRTTGQEYIKNLNALATRFANLTS